MNGRDTPFFYASHTFRKEKMKRIPIVFPRRLTSARSTCSFNRPKPTVCCLFTVHRDRHSGQPLCSELVAGKLTRLLVGTRNKGAQSFVVESIDGSLRYPQDFTYHVQNFTSLRSEKVLESGSESTFEYLFMPSETFNGRPMGLVVLINYRNNVREIDTCDWSHRVHMIAICRKENAFKMSCSIRQSISLMPKKDSTEKRKRNETKGRR